MREVVAELERPVLLFSGGKDSIVLLRLAEKAFRPGAAARSRSCTSTPATTSPRCIEFRDRRVARARPAADRRVGAGVDRQRPRRPRTGPARRATGCRPRTLLDALEARRLRRRVRRRAPRRGARPREGAHALASATSSASGTRARSGPSCGRSTTAGSGAGEQVRVFPLSNWTELDVWRYIERGGARAAVDLLRPRARGVRARRDPARRVRVRSSPRDGETASSSGSATAPSAT